MEEEKKQKLTYINENLIEKGYNPEELSNFIIKKTGIPMEMMGLEQLKDMIEKFKDQSLQDTYQTVKTKEVTKKEISPFDILYSNQVYDIKTQSPQNTLLLELESKKEKLIVNISEPKQEKAGRFFSKSIYSYRIVTPSIKKDVRRTYNDFEWLREQFLIRYPLRLVPYLIKENYLVSEEVVDKGDSEEIAEEKKVRYLNNFMNRIIQRKIFRTSPILFEFLDLDDNKFKQYKDKLNKNKYELNVTLDNLRTIKDKIHCKINTEDIKKADVFNKKYIKLGELYQKIEKFITNICYDFQLMEKHMKEISESFSQLSLLFLDIENKCNIKMKNIYLELNKVFDRWSECNAEQYKFFKNEFKPIFKLINFETQELSQIHKKYVIYKNEYEDYTSRVNKRKEELYEQKDYKNWSLVPGTENQLPMFQNNKKVAFEKMLYKETLFLGEEKKRIACTVHYLFKEYEKMIKRQSNELENFFKKIKEKNKVVIGDAYSLIELFSIIKENNNEIKVGEKNEEQKE
jgi:hypothetical protein